MNSLVTIPDNEFTLLCLAVVLIMCGIAWLAFTMGREVEEYKWAEKEHREFLDSLPNETIREFNLRARKELDDAQEKEEREGNR